MYDGYICLFVFVCVVTSMCVMNCACDAHRTTLGFGPRLAPDAYPRMSGLNTSGHYPVSILHRQSTEVLRVQACPFPMSVAFL